ncbi:MAG: hypothetical protein FJY88_05885 [Candidatus Eisenbacteria bacterium]|nr:hypothetical protein [Candidatus Eisenbacteria bacterium]
MRKLRVPLLVGAVLPLVAMLVLVSCGGKDKAERKIGEAAVEMALKGATGKDVDVQMEGKSVKIKQEGSETTIQETDEWPSDMFPAVPEFKFGKVTRVVGGDDAGMKKFNIYYDDVQEDGVEKYVELLKSGGWQASLMNMGPKGGMVTGQKGDLGLQFMFSKERKDGMLIVYSAPSQ